MIDDPLQFGIGRIEVSRLITAGSHSAHCFGVQAEQKNVFSADSIANFNVGTVFSTYGQRAVQSELHVAGAGRFGARSGYLLGQVGGGNDEAGNRHAIVGHEHHLQPVADTCIRIDGGGDITDELDNEFGHGVGGRCLAGKNHSTRHPIAMRVGQYALVTRDHMQHVQ